MPFIFTGGHEKYQGQLQNSLKVFISICLGCLISTVSFSPMTSFAVVKAHTLACGKKNNSFKKL